MWIFFRYSPGAFFFDGEVVSVHLDSEETGFSPVGSPTVSADPELYSVFFAPADDRDFVVDLGDEFGFGEDAAGVCV